MTFTWTNRFVIILLLKRKIHFHKWLWPNSSHTFFERIFKFWVQWHIKLNRNLNSGTGSLAFRGNEKRKEKRVNQQENGGKRDEIANIVTSHNELHKIQGQNTEHRSPKCERKNTQYTALLQWNNFIEKCAMFVGFVICK